MTWQCSNCGNVNPDTITVCLKCQNYQYKYEFNNNDESEYVETTPADEGEY